MSNMKSIEIEDKVFGDSQEIAKSLEISHSEYIHQAISYYNKLSKRKIQIEKLQKDSVTGGNNSSSIIDEMKSLQDSHFIL